MKLSPQAKALYHEGLELEQQAVALIELGEVDKAFETLEQAVVKIKEAIRLSTS